MDLLLTGRQVWAAWVGRHLGRQELAGVLRAVSAVDLLQDTWAVHLPDMVTVHHQVSGALPHQEITWAGLHHQVMRVTRSAVQRMPVAYFVSAMT